MNLLRYTIIALITVVIFQTTLFGSEADRNRQLTRTCKSQAQNYNGGNGQTTPMCQEAIYNKCVARALCDYYPDKCDRLESRVDVSCRTLRRVGDDSCPAC